LLVGGTRAHENRLHGEPNTGMATLNDVESIALSLPQVAKHVDDEGRPSYTVAGKAICWHREPRKDAPFEDIFVFRTADLESKELLLADPRGIFFTTPHWNGYPAVLIHIPHLRKLKRAEVRDAVIEAWLSRAPKSLAKAWLSRESEGAKAHTRPHDEP
jgi:hypothetical protein